jgi:hypothetical protein
VYIHPEELMPKLGALSVRAPQDPIADSTDRPNTVTRTEHARAQAAQAVTGPLFELANQRKPTQQDQQNATAFQAAARGALARRQVKVTGGDGQVTVNVNGDAAVFDKVGLGGMKSDFPKSFQYQAVDPHKFEVNLVGGKKLYHMSVMDGNDLKKKLLKNTPVVDADRHSVINGGFFNWTRGASLWSSQSATIGEADYLNGKPKNLPVPRKYREQYVTVDLGKTRFQSAPQLSTNGVVAFGDERLEEARFQRSNGGKPGMLKHANHPNPRSGISFPANIGYGRNTLDTAPVGPTNGEPNSKWDAIRMASVSAKRRGPDSDGMTMPEFSQTMARLDRINMTHSDEFPARSVNLDGGGSVYNATFDSKGNKVAMELPAQAHGAPNFVVASEKPKTGTEDS